MNHKTLFVGICRMSSYNPFGRNKELDKVIITFHHCRKTILKLQIYSKNIKQYKDIFKDFTSIMLNVEHKIFGKLCKYIINNGLDNCSFYRDSAVDMYL